MDFSESLSPPKEASTVDILHWIDRLEEELGKGRRLPFTSMVVVNEERLWDIIDNMRISIPEEVERARRVEQERTRILAKAREEGGRVVELARKQVEEITADHQLIQRARAEAAEIVARGESEVARLRTEADSYALGVLTQLENQLRRLLETVHNGVRLLSTQEGAEGSSETDS